ncbi:TetR family transcriptional regulator [Alkalihalophilus pseudofirmus]|nr:TetR family transcriptional regulator [Alkalihalophilus pseudofirmus]
MTFYLDKRIQRSKAALKKACLTLLYEKKFDSISITEIVQTANYNRGTFYANFSSKEDLLNEIIQDVLKEMILQIRKPYQSIKKVNLKKMQIGDITLFEYLKDNAKLYRLLLSDHIRMDFRFQMAKAIEELFETEYEYELAEGSQISLKWLYIYRAHGIAGLIIRWIEEDFPTSSHYMAKQVVELMLISTETFNVKG